MKRIYLDWGVVSNLKKPEFAEIRDFLLAHKGKLFFVYSPAHFEDAMRSDGDERLFQDIQTLESLVDDHLLAYNTKAVVQPYLASPWVYYRNHTESNLDAVPDITELMTSIGEQIPLLEGLLKSVLDMPFPIPDAARTQMLFSMMLPNLPTSPTFGDVVHSSIIFINKMMCDKVFYKSYRSAVRSSGFKLDSNAGNWKAEEVIPNISAIIKSLGINKTFTEFVLSGFGNRQDKVDTFMFFHSAYYLLDMIGYKSDKLPKSFSAMNSVNTDAQHAFYAAYCDYFITQDTHLASKARALYHEFRISTKVLSPADAVDELKEQSKENLVDFLREQLKEENIERRYDDSVVYKFDHRLWGIFTHCIVYDQNDGKLLEFKLAFDNYSRFIFYDEAGIMVDVVSDYFGRNSIVNYESVRKRIVSGDTETSINWEDENVLYTLKADPERHRPELYIEITIPFPGRAAKG